MLSNIKRKGNGKGTTVSYIGHGGGYVWDVYRSGNVWCAGAYDRSNKRRYIKAKTIRLMNEKLAKMMLGWLDYAPKTPTQVANRESACRAVLAKYGVAYHKSAHYVNPMDIMYAMRRDPQFITDLMEIAASSPE